MATKLASAVMLLSGQLAGHGVPAATIASTRAILADITFIFLKRFEKLRSVHTASPPRCAPSLLAKSLVGSAFFELNQRLEGFNRN
jgi:hypothetical protein